MDRFVDQTGLLVAGDRAGVMPRARTGARERRGRICMRKRVLVTGGAGFLGSHLCARLLNEENDVLCADNYFTGTRSNVQPLLNNPAFELIRHDITFPLYVEVDEIYNLACPASPIHYQHDPVQTTKTSVIGAINMLGLAKRLRARILQASTSEVYGDPDVHPQPENYRGLVNFNGPRGCYDEGKRCAETLFSDYERQHGLKTRVARIFNTYGPRMHPQDGRVVSNFIIQALTNEPITIYGDGNQVGDMIYVEDMAEILCRALLVEHGCYGKIFEAGTGERLTVNHIAEMVIEQVGQGTVKHRHMRPGETAGAEIVADVRTLEPLGEGRRSTSLYTGISLTLPYYRAIYEREQAEAGKVAYA